MKCDAKCKKLGVLVVVRGHSRAVVIAPFEMHRILACRSRHVCVPVLHRFWDMASCWWKTYPTCIWRHHWGWPHSNFDQDLWHQKTAVCVILRLAILLATDGHTVTAYKPTALV